jgi:hypothetical protein
MVSQHSRHYALLLFRLLLGQDKERLQQEKNSLQQEKDSLAEMRARMQEEYHKAIKTKKVGWENDLHRVTSEKKEKEKALQEASDQLDRTQIQLQLVQQQLRSADSEIKGLRKDKAVVESKLKKAQRTIDESSSASSEFMVLTVQLKEKDEAFEAEQQVLNTLRQEYIELQDQATVLQESTKRLEVQLSEYKSTIESEREQASAQLSEDRRKMEKDLQEAQNQIVALKKEKQNIESSLERSHSNEILLKDTQSQTSYELERMRAELVELENAKHAIEQESQQIRKAVECELQTLKMEHQNEIGDLQRRLNHAGAALKGSETKVEPIIYQNDQNLETYKRVAEQKTLQKLGLQEFLQVQLHQESTTNKDTPAAPLHKIHGGNPRRKVDRRTSSVASVDLISHDQTHVPSSGVKSGKVVHSGAVLPVLFEPVDASMVDDLGTHEHFSQDRVSILGLVPEPVPETQVQDSAMTFKDINQITERAPQNEVDSSSSISELRSDLFDGLSPMCASTPTGLQCKTGSHAPSELSFKAASFHTPRRSVENSMYDPQSCDRPKSRANTASRMKPLSPPSHRYRLDRDNKERAIATEPVRSRHSSSHRSNKTSDQVPSSPDYLHRSPYTARKTYGYHAGKSTTFSDSRRESRSRGLGQISSQKRKSSANHTGSETPAKRYKQSSHSIQPLPIPSSLPRDQERRAPGYPSMPQNSQGSRRTLSRATVTSSISRSLRKKSMSQTSRPLL